MKAVVMAGGEGSRLRPLTINRPKPMVPIANRPVMGHIVELLKRHRFSEILATLQYRADDIQNYFGDGSNFGIPINYSVEPRPLGTAGSVKFAEKFLDPAEPFLIISADAITDLDLTAIVEFHKRVGAAVTITLHHVPNPLEYGVIITDPAGRIERFLEKPSWGEVISDTVNTGIYVISPQVLDEIEAGAPCDFSKDLFPRLLQKGAPLYGFVADGYWCDVGNIAEYMRATGDLLEGRVQLGAIGRDRGGRVYVEDDAQIAPDARLQGPIYLGHDVQIKAGVTIIGPSAILPYSIVDNFAHIDRGIIWRNAYIGEHAQVRGAIIGPRCSLKSRAIVFEGAVIGDESMIGEQAVVHPNVKIWPGKQVDAGATLKSSLIWGAQARRTLFGRFGVTGLVNIDLTPEFAARLAAAFGAALPKGSTVTINRDPHRAARMIKRAMVSGLPSAGVNVEDLESLPMPVARFYTATSGAAGGAHARISPFDQRTVDVRFFGEDGLNLGKAKERGIESTFFREDFRRVAFNELGRIDEVAGTPERRYTRRFMQALNAEAIRAAQFKLVVDYASAPASLILPRILDELGCTVIALNERIDESKMAVPPDVFQEGLDQLGAITATVGAHFGARLDVGGERLFLVDQRGNKLPNISVAAAMLTLALRAPMDPAFPRAVAVMTNQPHLFEDIAARQNAQIVRTAIDAQAQMRAGADQIVMLAMSGAGEFIFPAFHAFMDGMFALAKLLELLAAQHATLADTVAQLPTYYCAQKKVPATWEMKGAVMRVLNEQYKDKIVEQVDGVKIQLGEREFALIVPEPDEPGFTIFAEANSDDAVAALIDRFARVIEGIRA